MKKLSVIIPVYNAEKWISETLNSLIAQTYHNIEIVCVDDESKDGSIEIIKNFKKKYANIILVSQKNAGVCAARNYGIEVSTGEYIAFLDADDLVESEAYEKMIEKIEKDNSDMVFCEFVRFWADGHKQYTVEENLPKLVKEHRDIRPFFLSTESQIEGETLYTKDIHGAVWRSVYKKNYILKNKIKFHTDLRFAEDQIFVLEYLQCCNKISYINKPFIHYRGWTKKNSYHNFYNNHIRLAYYQEQIIKSNDLYSEKEKRALIGYVRCSAYFMIVNDEFMFNNNAVKNMKKYSENLEFKKMLTVYNFIQKYKIRPEGKRIVLFILLKLKMWEIIKIFFPNKRY